MSMSRARKIKQKLVEEALLNDGVIQVKLNSLQWRYLETMVENGDFKRLDSDGIYAIYRLVDRGTGTAEKKEDKHE
jgi:hypothetical protein